MTDEHREYLNEVLGRAVPEIANWEPFDVAIASARFAAAVKADAERGEPCADALADELMRAGAGVLIEREKRRAAAGVILRRGHDGSARRRRNQGFRATQRQKPDGSRYWQQSIWWEMGYEDIVALFNAIEHAFLGMAEKRAGFGRVRAAYEAHRDAPNAAEACRRAGFDPREIGITDADIWRARGA